MNKSLVFALAALVVVIIGVWYGLSMRQDTDDIAVVPVPSATTTPAVVNTTNVYRDPVLGFSITFPTLLSSTTNDALYRVEALTSNMATGSMATIPGVKFTIPRVMTLGTNLSDDTHISVEHLGNAVTCDALAFMDAPKIELQTIREGTLTYSFASSSEAAAGNRYEEFVYAVASSSPCIAVRYFIHYGAIENYDASTTDAFNRTKLFNDFDTIRRSLTLK